MPFRRVEIRTPLSAEAVRDRIRQRLRPASPGFWAQMEAALAPADDQFPFKGTMAENHFEVVRIIRYRNAFLPVIRGEFSPEPGGGTTIRLTMTLPLLPAAVLVCWLGVAAFIVPWQPLHVEHGDSWMLIPIGFLLFGILLPIIGFYPEARKAERLIRAAVAP